MFWSIHEFEMFAYQDQLETVFFMMYCSCLWITEAAVEPGIKFPAYSCLTSCQLLLTSTQAT